MALATTDLFQVERSGVQYQMTADQIADFVGAVRDFDAADITARDALTGLVTGDRVFVLDASADATVDAGWAVYRYNASSAFDKIQEQESMDVVVTANLGYTASPTDGTVTNPLGTDATLPVVDGTNAGLATPQMFTDSHVAVTTTGTATTNPITVDGSQGLGFSIANLDPLP